MPFHEPRTRRLSAKTITRTLALAGHAMMGVAIGLGFALLTTRSDAYGIRPALMALDPTGFRLTDFAVTCALAFGVVATLTGLALTLGEEK
ncbi:hypothetical protein IP86_09550 [Rhodopseudomonas sp. AAP120]|uniref:hypothetical protein n=1 Tax=Rhodopseudomonas sp. AAP120 TaxID=1523430 RepID=UPI0006B96EE9|nr:hypothetical protein [Rhodopseudomonas sp. AAP120]KPF99210.1 hypothetical protein IP86_09550 [Rhodopseudomonas sp. AAP120]